MDPHVKSAHWLFWAFVALLSFAAFTVLSKPVGDALPPAQGQALSTLGMLPVILALPLRRAARNPVRWKRGALIAFLGGVASCLGNIPFLGALGEDSAKAASVFTITALYPLVTVLLAVGFLRERLTILQAAGIVLSLVGIYLLSVRDDRELISPWLVWALVPIVLWGAAGFLQKVSTFDVSGETSSVWFLAAFVPVGIVLAVLQPMPSAIPARVWALALALGFALAFGNYAVTVAYCGGKASIITPLVGLYPLISVPAALYLFGEQFGRREALGAVCSLISIAALSYEPPSAQDTSP